jgi:hypothetical protein
MHPIATYTCSLVYTLALIPMLSTLNLNILYIGRSAEYERLGTP